MSGLADSLTNPWMILPWVFQLWMLVDAVRRQEWIWALFMLIFPFFNAVLYYFLVYRPSAPAGPAIEFPGVERRARIKELLARIHHLDKAHDHRELGDVYMAQGRLQQAEASYRAAIERDAEDRDAQAHLGRCLLLQKRAAEAATCLERVCQAEPHHDYGETSMALAEAYAVLGRATEAINCWRRVLERNSYARARVQLAELLEKAGAVAEAGSLAREVVDDDAHAPRFQRNKDRQWVARARALARRGAA